MKFILNNREEELERENITVAEMFELKKYTFRLRIIKINGKLIPGKEYTTTYIRDGDNVQMIYLMSGG